MPDPKLATAAPVENGGFVWKVGGVAAEFPSAIPDSGIARLEYEDDSNTSVAIDSWNNNDGTVFGATYTTDALVGTRALQFSPANSTVVNLGDIAEADAVGQFSWSVWIKPDDLSTYRYIAGKGSPPDGGSGYNLNTNNSVVRCQVHDGGVSTITGSTLNTGIEYMITGVIDANNSEFRLYTNGQRDATGVLSSATVSTTAEPFRHSWNPGGYDYLSGVGDDLRLYSKALTDTEVSNLYNTGSI